MKTLLAFIMVLLPACGGALPIQTAGSALADQSSATLSSPSTPLQTTSEAPLASVDPVVASSPTPSPTPSVTSRPALLGDGSEISPYAIRTVSDLEQVSDHMGSYFNLLADLDLTGVAWQPIGSPSNPFMGMFNGNSYKILNLTIDEPTAEYVGLFGYSGGSITHLVVTVNLTGSNYVGAIVALNVGIISNCTGTGALTGVEAQGLDGYSPRQSGVVNSTFNGIME